MLLKKNIELMQSSNEISNQMQVNSAMLSVNALNDKIQDT